MIKRAEKLLRRLNNEIHKLSRSSEQDALFEIRNALVAIMFIADEEDDVIVEKLDAIEDYLVRKKIEKIKNKS